ncbi:hypothetical protein D9M72_519820 [compost metagenome]
MPVPEKFVAFEEVRLEPESKINGAPMGGNVDGEVTRWRHRCRHCLFHVGLCRLCRAGSRFGTCGGAGMFRAMVGGHKILQVSEKGRPVPHRACERLHRQHLAYPDGADGKGLCRPARRRGEAEGVQGRFDG